MKANWRRSQARSKPKIDRFAIKKFELRTEWEYCPCGAKMDGERKEKP